MPKSMNTARTKPPDAAQPLGLCPLCNISAVVAAVEFTVTVAVPVLVPLVRVIVEVPTEQVGNSVAPAGDVVNAQVRVTAPA